MNAEGLAVGDRVKLTAAGLAQFANRRRPRRGVPMDEALRGTVTGTRGHHPSDWRYVQVQREGIKRPECYFVGFWEKAA